VDGVDCDAEKKPDPVERVLAIDPSWDDLEGVVPAKDEPGPSSQSHANERVPDGDDEVVGKVAGSLKPRGVEVRVVEKEKVRKDRCKHSNRPEKDVSFLIEAGRFWLIHGRGGRVKGVVGQSSIRNRKPPVSLL
jgi:hypothetical protein